MPRTALLAGATGLIGGHVLELLLADPDCKHLYVLVRRPTGKTHDKLTEHVVDFDNLDTSLDGWRSDDVYVCLGTTIKVAGSEERFRQVDHDYPVEVARIAHDHGATRLALVSSVGASATASSFYLRVKGETERDVKALAYDTLTIMRPSILLGQRTEKRTGERIGIVVARALAFTMVGGLRPYRPIHSRTVAAAMIAGLKQPEPGTTVKEHDAIRLLGGEKA